MPPLCIDCEKLSLDALRDHDVPLKENLAALIDSATDGCSFCSLCWTQFQKDCTSDKIQRHLRGEFVSSEKSSDWRIYLNAELHEHAAWHWSNGEGSHIDKVWSISSLWERTWHGYNIVYPFERICGPRDEMRSPRNLLEDRLILPRHWSSCAPTGQILHRIEKP